MFTLQFLIDIFPVYKGKLREELTIKQILTDSRRQKKDSLFIPIVGERFNGHDFLNQAIENGAVAAFWDKSRAIPEIKDDSFIFFIVEDTMKAMQLLAKEYRNVVNPIVIGITGSNGKTTTKDLMNSVLQTERKTHATKGNFNNHVGLPITILEMERDTEVLVLEMGMNHFNEIDVLTKIAQPDYAIITNIGESHIEHLGSREGILNAKLEIRNGLKKDGKLLIDGDEEIFGPLKHDKQVITCGFENDNQVVIEYVSIEDDETSFEIDQEQYIIPLLGTHHAKNASFAVTVAKRMNYQFESIKKGLQSIQHTSMRFERILGKEGATIINDAYNASVSSMKAAIEVIKQMKGFDRKVVVLGDILELGTYSGELHREVASTIDFPIQNVYSYGKDSKEITDRVKELKPDIVCNHYDNKEELTEEIKKLLQKDTLLLFKGSRGMKLEEIIEEITE